MHVYVALLLGPQLRDILDKVFGLFWVLSKKIALMKPDSCTEPYLLPW